MWQDKTVYFLLPCGSKIGETQRRWGGLKVLVQLRSKISVYFSKSTDFLKKKKKNTLSIYFNFKSLLQTGFAGYANFKAKSHFLQKRTHS